MKATCKTNNLHETAKDLLHFAFMQDKEGVVPLTPGQTYDVYGIKKNRFGIFLFVVGDGETLPWWMPAALFEPVTEPTPDHWKTDTYPSVYDGEEVVTAPEVYFGNEDNIEDGTKKGYRAFAQMRELARRSQLGE